jgi:hypothetical protein
LPAWAPWRSLAVGVLCSPRKNESTAFLTGLRGILGKHRSVTDITERRTGFSDCVHTGSS